MTFSAAALVGGPSTTTGDPDVSDEEPGVNRPWTAAEWRSRDAATRAVDELLHEACGRVHQVCVCETNPRRGGVVVSAVDRRGHWPGRPAGSRAA